jgi:hypothetical protein
VDGEGENQPRGDEKDAYADAHIYLPPWGSCLQRSKPRAGYG